MSEKNLKTVGDLRKALQLYADHEYVVGYWDTMRVGISSVDLVVRSRRQAVEIDVSIECDDGEDK